MGIREDIINIFVSIYNFFVEDFSSSSFFELFYPIVTIVVIGVIVFAFVRIWRYSSSYVGDGEPLGPVKITIQQMTTVKGNLSIYEYPDDMVFDLLETLDHEEGKELYKNFRTRYGEGKLFVYWLRVTDWDEAFDLKGGKDAIIVSPVPIESNEYSWIDSKGERSITSPTFKQKSRNVICFGESRWYHDIETPEGIIDIYDLVPFPKTLVAKLIDGRGTEAVLELQKLGSGKADGMAAAYLPTIAENWEEIEPYKAEVERLKKMLKKLHIDLNDLEREREDDRSSALFNPMIGHKKKAVEIPQMSWIMTLILVFVAGGITGMLPHPQIMNLNIHPIIFVGGGAIVLLLILQYKLSDKDKGKSTSDITPFGGG